MSINDNLKYYIYFFAYIYLLKNKVRILSPISKYIKMPKNDGRTKLNVFNSLLA